MEPTRKYFSLNDTEHIGTVKAMCNETLNNAIKTALETHYDVEVTFPRQVGEAIVMEGPQTFTALVDGVDYEITISETWIY